MLRKTIKELSFHSLIYMIGGTASTLASIVLLPVYTRFLSKADYGILEIIDSSRYLLIIILLAGFEPTMGKFYNEETSPQARKEVISTAFVFVFCSALFWSVLLVFFNDNLADALLGNVSFVAYINLGILLLCLQALLTTGETYLNIRKQSMLFVGFSLVKLFLNVGANLYFIVLLRLGAKGMLYGELLSTGIIVGILSGYLFRQNGMHFQNSHLKPMLKFSLPFIPNALSASLMHRIDRYLLQHFTSLAEVGVYGLGYKFPFMLNFLILSSFGKIWYPSVMYDVAKQEDYQRTYAKVTTYFVTVYIVCQYVLIIMATTVVKVLAAPEYAEAWRVIQVIGLGMCFYSIHPFVGVGAFIKDKTWLLPISHILAALINFFLNWYLLPRYGYMAAAWNTVITYFAYSFLNYIVFKRIYPIPFEFRRIGILFGLGIILVLTNNALQLENGILEVVKQILFAVTLPLILILGPFLDKDEKNSLHQVLHKTSPKLAHLYSNIISRLS